MATWIWTICLSQFNILPITYIPSYSTILPMKPKQIACITLHKLYNKPTKWNLLPIYCLIKWSSQECDREILSASNWTRSRKFWSKLKSVLQWTAVGRERKVGWEIGRKFQWDVKRGMNRRWIPEPSLHPQGSKHFLQPTTRPLSTGDIGILVCRCSNGPVT